MPLSLKIKQVTGQETFPVQVEPSDTVAALKDAVAAHLGCEASGLRLIYRGSILKDASTLESYGGCGTGAALRAGGAACLRTGARGGLRA